MPQRSRLRWPLSRLRVASGRTIISRGLVGYWKLNDAGPIAHDSSIYGINGTYNGTYPTNNVPLALAPGSFSRVFNGASDYVSTTNTAPLPVGAAARTLCGWVRTTVTARQSYFGYGGNTAGTAFDLESGVASAGKIYFVGFTNDLAGNTNIADGRWHHIAVTYTGTVVALYVDGVFDSSTAQSLNTSGVATFPFSIGRQSYGDSGIAFYYVMGGIADVRLYNRVLVSSELVQIVSGLG